MKKRNKHYSPHWRPGMDIKRQRRRRKSRRLIISILIVFFFVLAFFSIHLFLIPVGKSYRKGYVFIGKRTNSKDVLMQLDTTLNLHTPRLFDFYGKLVGLNDRLRRGKYAVRGSMSHARLLMALIHDAQVPVKVSFNSVRTQDELLKRLTHNLEMSPDELQSKLEDPAYCATMGCDTTTIRTIFLPDSYEFYWSVSPEHLIEKIYSAYRAFWTPQRIALAESEGFTPQQISVLASIVEEESSKPEEYSRIAGLYVNRLRRNIPLQADPSVKYAVGDFSLKRILAVHTMVDSPYNTYKIHGLPPGPIRYPQKSTIEKVLHFEHHKYLYMCANPDFSGTHLFATNYLDHLQNAYRYRSKLDEMGIK